MKFNKKTECLLYVLLGVFSGIIGSSIMIFIIYNYEDKKEFIKIVISIVGLFTTFGGAYVGAYLSGRNALYLKKKELIYERKIM
ncbi:H+/Cl- antiporter ClcA [Staphylococcus hominis]